MRERVVEEKRRLVVLEISRKNAGGLQVRNLPRRERNQFAHALVKRRIRAEAQERRHFGPGVADEIVGVAQLVMRRGKPPWVRLHAHQGADVAIQIDVPAAGMGVLPARLAGLHRIQVRRRPERGRQFRETDAGVEFLRCFHDPLR